MLTSKGMFLDTNRLMEVSIHCLTHDLFRIFSHASCCSTMDWCVYRAGMVASSRLRRLESRGLPNLLPTVFACFLSPQSSFFFFFFFIITTSNLLFYPRLGKNFALPRKPMAPWRRLSKSDLTPTEPIQHVGSALCTRKTIGWNRTSPKSFNINSIIIFTTVKHVVRTFGSSWEYRKKPSTEPSKSVFIRIDRRFSFSQPLLFLGSDHSLFWLYDYDGVSLANNKHCDEMWLIQLAYFSDQ